jgi:hypothetical protein
MSSVNTWVAKYGPWAVVTGASDGIGREAAVELAKAGISLVLVARRRHLLEELAAILEQRFHVRTQIIGADLATRQGVDEVLAAADTVDVGLLVAAAGFGTSGRFLELPLERELDMLALNCEAVLLMSHHFAQRFAGRGRGGIILFSSLVAFQGVPYAAHYAATKAYIQSLAEALHYELGPLGVDVLASAPGPVNSGFASAADMQMGAALAPATVAQETLAALGRRAAVRPGLLSKVLIGSLALIPRGWRVGVMARIMKGMTRHQARVPAAAS